jgi:hypothetical protein
MVFSRNRSLRTEYYCFLSFEGFYITRTNFLFLSFVFPLSGSHRQSEALHATDDFAEVFEKKVSPRSMAGLLGLEWC